MGEAEPSYPSVTADWRTRHGRRQRLHYLGNTRSIVPPGQRIALASTASMRVSTYHNKCSGMETKRPCIRVRACRHVSAPDLHEAGRRLLPLARGPVTIQVVRDPMRGPGLPRGSGFLGRSGAPAVRLSACLFRDTWRSWTFPSRETGPGPLSSEQDSGPQGSGRLDVVKDNYKALA